MLFSVTVTLINGDEIIQQVSSKNRQLAIEKVSFQLSSRGVNLANAEFYAEQVERKKHAQDTD